MEDDKKSGTWEKTKCCTSHLHQPSSLLDPRALSASPHALIPPISKPSPWTPTSGQLSTPHSVSGKTPAKNDPLCISISHTLCSLTSVPSTCRGSHLSGPAPLVKEVQWPPLGRSVGCTDTAGCSLSGLLGPALLWHPLFSLDTCLQAPLRTPASTNLEILFLRPPF